MLNVWNHRVILVQYHQIPVLNFKEKLHFTAFEAGDDLDDTMKASIFECLRACSRWYDLGAVSKVSSSEQWRHGELFYARDLDMLHVISGDWEKRL